MLLAYLLATATASLLAVSFVSLSIFPVGQIETPFYLAESDEVPTEGEPEWATELRNHSLNGLLGNLVVWKNQTFLTAGAVQYRSLWVRDAAHCSSALRTAGLGHVMANLIDLYVLFLRDGTGPKVFDVMNPELRSIVSTLRQALGLPRVALKFPPDAPLTALYKDSRGSTPIDSNLLMIIAALDLEDQSLIERRAGAFCEMLGYYDGLASSDGLLHQPAFSDWQDSQRREGVTFLTNLLYWRAGSGLEERCRGLVSTDFEELRHRMVQTFFDGNLFRSVGLAAPHVSLDGNLLAIRWGFAEDPEKLYAALRASALWDPFPGRCTFPDYPRGNSSWQVKIPGVGLQHYHDSMHWSWLIALSAETAYRLGDLQGGDAIGRGLHAMVRRDGGVAEVYTQHTTKDGLALLPFRSLLYESEKPFSWGAAYGGQELEEKRREETT
uniref:Glycogen debranching enzyme C-terminal domain-containing protein n=1 Tax=Chromera velia CCMP2878 TaxID=1169474 RepID=A0A0G4HF77_9ALVE|eukprot:Cvel_26832.t1-p1 / transcript=Cvel_26832.t1 / gene=Cvel_26832 / organism=Chromera_velia_CCMP2878 / gene_product=hypothetical protein / transcript_product=hypothetical protein / location=Cvel_scaffold3252:9521-13172(+) / protein_length=439 / sequence_SO=supercontig / SO=protein_coding / is_pseudo=false